jgi:hypothetical protein
MIAGYFNAVVITNLINAESRRLKSFVANNFVGRKNELIF